MPVDEYLVRWDYDSFHAHHAAVQHFARPSNASRALATSLEWIENPDDDLRAAALDVMGVLARRDDSLKALVLLHAERGLTSQNDDVRWSSVAAVEGIIDPRTETLLLTSLADKDPDVRHRAVISLGSLDDEHGVLPDALIGGLISASSDADPDVRDWATFALARHTGPFTAAIRTALISRLGDSHDDVVGEATVGLAFHADPAAFDVLVSRLSEPDIGNIFVEAASVLGDRRLLPLLLDLEKNGWKKADALPSYLDQAIAACAGVLTGDLPGTSG